MSATGTEIEAGGQTHAHEIEVEVHAPSVVKPKRFAFPPTTKVGTAAAEAALKFGVDVANPTFQKGAVVLPRDETLARAGVKEHDTLELVDGGGGV